MGAPGRGREISLRQPGNGAPRQNFLEPPVRACPIMLVARRGWSHCLGRRPPSLTTSTHDINLVASPDLSRHPRQFLAQPDRVKDPQLGPSSLMTAGSAPLFLDQFDQFGTGDGASARPPESCPRSRGYRQQQASKRPVQQRRHQSAQPRCRLGWPCSPGPGCQQPGGSYRGARGRVSRRPSRRSPPSRG